MKNKNGVLLALFSLVAVLAFAPGCVHVPVVATDGTVTTNTLPNVKAMKTIAKSAAYLGTFTYLQNRPQDRDLFELTRTSLQTLIAAGTFSVADLKAALQKLPIKQLQGTQGSVIVGEAVILWDEYGTELAALDSSQIFNTYVLPVAQALLEGLDLALGGATPDFAAPGLHK